ncbi:MAG: PadR family transcriptional regulator [Gemmatimonadota bacterium]|nr:PadR family transcriptional regulator [Gemmatimonadota bacterium]
MARNEFWLGFDPGEWDWLGFKGPFGGREGHRRGHRRGRRGRQWFGPGDMKYVVLKLLKEKPMHGYEVMKALEEQTQGCYKPSPGTVYPTLQWLEDEGLVKCEQQEDGKKIYSITDAGLEFLEENKTSVEDIFDRVKSMIDQVVGDPMPEVNKAVGRLVAQVYKSSWQLSDNSEKRRQIVTALDEARETIEGLVG